MVTDMAIRARINPLLIAIPELLPIQVRGIIQEAEKIPAGILHVKHHIKLISNLNITDG